MRRCAHLLSSFLNVLTDIADATHSVTFSDAFRQPHIPTRPLPFIPPPRWAAELSRQLAKKFPDLEQRHHTRYLQAFTHPSFATNAGVHGTMDSFVPLGKSVIEKAASDWVIATFDDIRNEEYTALIALLMSDTSLSQVLRDHWQMENMILTDRSADLFSRERVRSAAGLARWLSSSGYGGSSQCLPDPYVSNCVKAMTGAVFLEHGYSSVDQFVKLHILPFLL